MTPHEYYYGGISVEPLTHIHQRAHPGGGMEIVETQSGEGLVEDQYEAHLKNLYVAYREPAAVRVAGLAAQLEKAGFAVVAAQVDEALGRFYQPEIVKTVVAEFDAGMAALMFLSGPMLGYGIYKAIMGLAEGIVDDTQDLVRSIGGWKDLIETDQGTKLPTGEEAWQEAGQLADLAKQLVEQFNKFVELKKDSTEQVAASQSLELASQTKKQMSASISRINTLFDNIQNTVGGFVQNPQFIGTWGALGQIDKDLKKIEEQVSGAKLEAQKQQTQSAQQPAQSNTNQRPAGQPVAKLAPEQNAKPTGPKLAPDNESWAETGKNFDRKLNSIQQLINMLIVNPANKPKVEAALTPQFEQAYKTFKTVLWPGLQNGQYSFPNDEEMVSTAMGQIWKIFVDTYDALAALQTQ